MGSGKGKLLRASEKGDGVFVCRRKERKRKGERYATETEKNASVLHVKSTGVYMSELIYTYIHIHMPLKQA